MHEQLHLTTTWIGILSLIIFVVGYYFIAAEDKYHINKAKPALLAGYFYLYADWSLFLPEWHGWTYP